MCKKKEFGGFEEGMLKFVCMLLKVLKYLFLDKVVDVCNFMNFL